MASIKRHQHKNQTTKEDDYFLNRLIQNLGGILMFYLVLTISFKTNTFTAMNTDVFSSEVFSPDMMFLTC